MGTVSYATSVSVLVVDDHEVARRGLASLLAEVPGMRLIGEASSGEAALRIARDRLPDVVLMDLRMPGMGGLEAARRIHGALPQTRIIAVTACEDEPRWRLSRNGFSDCVGKNVDTRTLETVIRRALGTNALMVAEPLPEELERNPFHVLTGREFQVTSLMLAGLRAGEIAARLFIAPKTVHTFRYRIFEKLGITGDIELAKLAAIHGLIGATAPELQHTPAGAHATHARPETGPTSRHSV